MKDSISSYQAKLNSSPSLNRNTGGMMQGGNNNAQGSNPGMNMMMNKPNYITNSGTNLPATSMTQPISSSTTQQQTPQIRSHSSSNNREPSPYSSGSGPNINTNINKPNPNSNINMNKPSYNTPTSTTVYASSIANQPSMSNTMAMTMPGTTTQPVNNYYGKSNTGMYANNTGANVTAMGGKNYPVYEQPKPAYDNRGYYPPNTGYDPRIQPPINYPSTATYSTPVSSIPPYHTQHPTTIRPPTSYPTPNPYSNPNPPTYGMGMNPTPAVQHSTHSNPHSHSHSHLHGGRLM